MLPEIMTIEQVADYLQLHPQVVYRHVRAGTLPASRIGRTIRFKKSVLDAFLEKGAWEFANQYLTFVTQAKAASATSRPHTQITAASARTSVVHEPPPAVEVEESRQFSTDVD